MANKKQTQTKQTQQNQTYQGFQGTGDFNWYELMTNDVNKAKTFYSELMGWKVQLADEKTGYYMFMLGDRPVAGLMELPAEAKKMGAGPHWMGYVHAKDVDVTTKHAEKLGGKTLVPATDMGGVGRWSLLQDPQGATIATYKPSHEPAPFVNQVGDFTWHELYTTDPAAAWGFYSKLFNFMYTDTMDMGPMGPYTLFMAGPNDGCGMMKKPADMPAPSHWLYYVRVDDLDSACARVTKMGGKILNGPMDVPGGDRVAQCMDPQGAAFALHMQKKG